MTEQEILKKFEELGFYFPKVSNELRKLTIANDNEEIYIRIWKDKTYDFDGYMSLQIHQLLTELFKCWGWIE